MWHTSKNSHKLGNSNTQMHISMSLEWEKLPKSSQIVIVKTTPTSTVITSQLAGPTLPKGHGQPQEPIDGG